MEINEHFFFFKSSFQKSIKFANVCNLNYPDFTSEHYTECTNFEDKSNPWHA